MKSDAAPIYMPVFGCFCVFHSKYKGFSIYRAHNMQYDRPKMEYHTSRVMGGDIIKFESSNLAGIKKKITEELRGRGL